MASSSGSSTGKSTWRISPMGRPSRTLGGLPHGWTAWQAGWWWLVAMNLAFSHIYWVSIIIPIDFHIFQRGGEKPPTSKSSMEATSFPPWLGLSFDHALPQELGLGWSYAVWIHIVRWCCDMLNMISQDITSIPCYCSLEIWLNSHEWFHPESLGSVGFL